MQDNKPTLCVDFDGVIHSYRSGWQGFDQIPDPPVEGALEWLSEVVDHFDVCIFSSRSKMPEGLSAMQKWLFEQGLDVDVLAQIRWPVEKPAAHLLVDDRAMQFIGDFPTVKEIKAFRPWYKSNGEEQEQKQE